MIAGERETERERCMMGILFHWGRSQLATVSLNEKGSESTLSPLPSSHLLFSPPSSHLLSSFPLPPLISSHLLFSPPSPHLSSPPLLLFLLSSALFFSPFFLLFSSPLLPFPSSSPPFLFPSFPYFLLSYRGGGDLFLPLTLLPSPLFFSPLSRSLLDTLTPT